MYRTINVSGKLLPLSRPVVMGIINATPDSFYSQSRTQASRDISARADEIIAEGGVMIDVGGCSTRPGFTDIGEEEEMMRLRAALEAVRQAQPDSIVSVDTFRPDVARMAVEEYGASIINDVAAGWGTMEPHTGQPDELPPMFAMVAKLQVPYVFTSHCGTICDMTADISHAVSLLHGLGVNDIIADPGFGFGKTLDQNYTILAHLSQLKALDLPMLVGVSRKSMATRLLGVTAGEALNATTSLHTAALLGGASILRAHDVREAVETCRVVAKLMES